jgi:hypothetical protein
VPAPILLIGVAAGRRVALVGDNGGHGSELSFSQEAERARVVMGERERVIFVGSRCSLKCFNACTQQR